MKKENNTFLSFVIIFLLMLGSGCQDTGPIEIIDNQDDSRFIEMITVGTIADSVSITSGVDSTGLVSGDYMKYYGRLIFSSIRNEMFSRQDSLIKAEAIFIDTSKPILHNGRVIAYTSLDVGTLSLDSDTLGKHVRYQRIPMSMMDTIIGYKYHFRKSYNYNPGKTYTWKGTDKKGTGTFDASFKGPPEMQVTDIVPPYIQVTEPMRIKWNCTNQYVHIIISREGGLQQKTWLPTIHLRIRNTRGEIFIPTKILALLPTRRFQQFMFTFMSEERFTMKIEGYQDSVLVQAASIHNRLLRVNL